MRQAVASPFVTTAVQYVHGLPNLYVRFMCTLLRAFWHLYG